MPKYWLEENNMVYVKKEGQEMKERKTVRGKLIGISCRDSGVVNQEKGQFHYLDLTIVRKENDADKFYNIRCYGRGMKGKDAEPIDLESPKLKMLKRADELLKTKKHPLVCMTYYETDSVVTNKETNEKKV